MNTLFFIDRNNNLKQNLINNQLKEPRTLLITKNNQYKNENHVIEAKLYPQDKLINDIGLLITNNHLSMNLDIWDDIYNELLGQDVNSLVLSIIGSFVNNITEPRKIIIDNFDEMAPSIQKRVLDVLVNSKRYGLSTFITTDNIATVNIEQILMHVDIIYIPVGIVSEDKAVQSILDHEDLAAISNLSKSEMYIKRIERNCNLD